jgi:peptidoglycan/LPS O-acetylase OafA/YrhL
MVDESDDLEACWIGLVSYTSYLIYAGVLAVVTPSSSLIVNRALAFAVVIAYASLSWGLLEKPILRLRPSAWLIARRSKLQSTRQVHFENV